MKRQVVLRVVGKLLIPYMLMFALYVQFHGDFGPGGGFQAGVITAASVIFYALIYGLPAARRVVPEAVAATSSTTSCWTATRSPASTAASSGSRSAC